MDYEPLIHPKKKGKRHLFLHIIAKKRRYARVTDRLGP